jgi:hypothetical protein
MSCGFLGRYRRFGGIYCPIFSVKMKTVCFSETLVFTTSPYSVTFQETNSQCLHFCENLRSHIVKLYGLFMERNFHMIKLF